MKQYFKEVFSSSINLLKQAQPTNQQVKNNLSYIHNCRAAFGFFGQLMTVLTFHNLKSQRGGKKKKKKLRFAFNKWTSVQINSESCNFENFLCLMCTAVKLLFLYKLIYCISDRCLCLGNFISQYGKIRPNSCNLLCPICHWNSNCLFPIIQGAIWRN